VAFEKGCRRPKGLNDSKKLTPAQRERLYRGILETGIVSVVVASRERIDRLNIFWATMWGMRRAVAGLAHKPDHVLIDGRSLPPGLACPGEALVGGDGLSVSIAAASIVAKVTRDRLMTGLSRGFPAYGFAHNFGYATPEHLAALTLHGPCLHHRRSFAPVRLALAPETEELPFDPVPTFNPACAA
jgi:ribonuclease HII